MTLEIANLYGVARRTLPRRKTMNYTKPCFLLVRFSLFFLASILPCDLIWSQELGPYLKRLIDERTSGAANPEHFRISSVPICDALKSQVEPRELGFLEQRMSVSDGKVTFDQTKLLKPIVEEYSRNVIIGTRTLSQSETASLKAASELIKDAQGNPTPAYKKYKEFENRDETLRGKLRLATTASQMAEIRADITENDEQWELFGRKGAVRAALGIIQSYSSESDQDLFLSWKKAIQTEKVVDYSQLYSTLTSGRSATNIRIETVPAIQDAVVRFGTPANPTKLSNVKLRRIEFSVVRIPTPNQLLTHRVLQSNKWKHKSDLLLSDGNGGALVDYVPKELFVIYDLQIELAENEAWEAVSNLLSTESDLTMEDFPLKSQNGLHAFLLPGFIKWHRPFVVGVVANRLAKTPVPDQNLTWEN